MRIDNNMLGYFATHQQKLDEIVEELARVGFPDCNTDQAQNAAAIKIGYRDAEDMYEQLSDEDVAHITQELRKRVL